MANGGAMGAGAGGRAEDAGGRGAGAGGSAGDSAANAAAAAAAHPLGRAATLTDVARHAGVSLATASRVVNGSTRTVNPRMRERVLASAAVLSYTANVQAQAVARGTGRTVALVVGDIADPYFASIASGVSRAAAGRGLTVTIAMTGDGAEAELAAVAAVRGQRPQAVIMAGSRRTDLAEDDPVLAELHAVEALGGTVAFIGTAVAFDDGSTQRFAGVEVDHRAGARALAQALLSAGYRDFGILAGPASLLTPVDRSAGFVGALSAPDCAPGAGRIVHGPFTRDGGYDAMTRMLAAGPAPECVFAVADVMAVGAMAAIREHGLRPGIDVGVAGFDDIPILQDLAPSLTTVALPLVELGERALEVALGETGDAGPIVGRVIVRESTPGR
ncbi:LacI family DNA-binding transcriptional regulator [Microbacterium sp. STN6]|uniref:LacI family DNA-binding transcriptional regulator n=1 Tax=Microbacterium sp. STN6 TaxID=2995588 RepID=UPI0022608A5D|nr:LacI family DNA-binding transcriptional regulator [Microbacterium sp. STN6]MCX7520809.1 LacI family DNA-binding transcriptional regulator [Microbacterium sp. STN6]